MKYGLIMSSVKQARKSLIDHALNEIRNIPNYSDFYKHTYYVIAKLGLQRKAKKEALFETADWNSLERRNAIFAKIERFLFKYIK